MYAIVSRKSGPLDSTYLWQYLLKDDGHGHVTGTLVRKFGKYSGTGEIESIAVDNELGFIYYSDEKVGVRKYYADPKKGNEELALFATEGFEDDHEGISIYKLDDGTGYILISDQEADEFHIYTREGTPSNPHDHRLLKVVEVKADESDGSDLLNFPILPHFPNGIFVAMSNNKTFHLYRWEDIAGEDLKIKPPSTISPDTPALVTPVKDSIGVNTSPLISWNASPGAIYYRLQVSDTPDFSKLIIDQKGIQSLSTQITGLMNNAVYFWRLKATNIIGSSDWTNPWNFTTALPVTPLVGHWKMDADSGTTLKDATIYKNNAIITGRPDWIKLDSGGAIKFNGIDQYAIVPDTPSLDITKTITLTAWIQPNQKGTQNIIKKALQNKIDGYELSLSSRGKVFFRLNHASANDTFRVNSSTYYPYDGSTWMHVAATFDGSVMKIYINGVENDSLALMAPTSINANDVALSIGAQYDGSYAYHGAIDDARVYNTVLSPEEINQLASVLPSLPTPLAQLSASRKLNLHEILQAYPNPFATKATIWFTLPTSGAYTISIQDYNGTNTRYLKQGKAVAGEKNIIEIDGSNLSQGLYLVRLYTNTGYTKTLRLMLIK